MSGGKPDLRKSVGVGTDDFTQIAGAQGPPCLEAIEFLMNFTEPSAKQTLTLPGWLLVGAMLHRVPHQ